MVPSSQRRLRFLGCTHSSTDGWSHGLHCADAASRLHTRQLPCGQDERRMTPAPLRWKISRDQNEKRVRFGLLPDYKERFWLLTAHSLKGFSCSQLRAPGGPWGIITFRKLLVRDLRSWASSQRGQPLGFKGSWNEKLPETPFLCLVFSD